MLNGIHLVDFGNHRDTRLTFGRMTALVGQNGSGKTTVMRAVGELKLAIVKRDFAHLSSGLGRKGASEASLSASWLLCRNDRRYDCGLVLDPLSHWILRARLPNERNYPWLPKREDEDTDGMHILDSLSEIKHVEPGELAFFHEAPKLDWSCRYFKTSASSLQRPAIADPKATVLNGDGSNLAWALASLMTEQPNRFHRIVEALREVVPIVRSIRSKAVSLTQTVKQTITINKRDRAFDEEREVNGQELIFDMKSGDGLPATSVSEGTLVVLAVLTLVYGSDADLIMLDDVELGLHPKAQRDLIRQLRRIQETHPQLQIIVSTHSPYVVDEFKAEDVWVFAPDKEGCAVAKRLSEHPDAKRALEVLTTGEFWSAEGEPWVLDETPAARVAEEPGA